jgi:hypothetical protein
MDEVGGDVNWSEVVRPAIQRAIAIHQQRRSPTMSTVIERLRASKQEAEQEDIAAGKARGRAWAEHKADYRQLRRVCKLDLSEETDAETALSYAIYPDGDNYFREEALGMPANEEPTDEFIAGFIEGAQEFFDEVEDEL